MQLWVDRDQAVRHQLIAEQPRLFTRGFGGVAAQQREQRLDLFRYLALAAGQRAFDDAALQPARIARLEHEAFLAQRLQGLAERREGRSRQARLVVERTEAR